MKVGVIGIDFTCTTMEILEKRHFTAETAQQFASRLKESGACEEAVVLSTCNRTECYISAENLSHAMVQMKEIIGQFWNISHEDWHVFYELTGADAIKHLFQVTSGCKSMVVGENEILGQVKKAYNLCQAQGLTKSNLNKLFQTAIYVGKRSREETNISAGSQSVSSIAVDAVHHHFSGIPGRSILIVGAGIMCERALKKITALGHYEVHVTNRTPKRAKKVAQEYGVAIYPYEKLEGAIHEFDSIYYATQSQTFLITQKDVATCEKPTLLVDIGLPRNVDPAVLENKWVNLVSLESLKQEVDDNLEKRREELSSVQTIIDEEVLKYQGWYTHRLSQQTLEACLSV